MRIYWDSMSGLLDRFRSVFGGKVAADDCVFVVIDDTFADDSIAGDIVGVAYWYADDSARFYGVDRHARVTDSATFLHVHRREDLTRNIRRHVTTPELSKHIVLLRVA